MTQALPATLVVNVAGATLAALIILIDADRREMAYRFRHLASGCPARSISASSLRRPCPLSIRLLSAR